MSVDQSLSGPLARRRERALSLRNSYDLALLYLLALLMPTALLTLPAALRLPLGLVAALLAPGYALVAALLPQRSLADGMVRAALSFGLSVAILPAAALLLHYSPWAIRPLPVATALALWIAALSTVALLRRRALLPEGQAYCPPPVDLRARWRALGGPARLRYLASALALVAGAALMARLAMAPDPGRHMTEFYALGRAGLAEDYPRAAVAGQDVALTVGIVNREGALATYSVEVWAVSPWDGGRRLELARTGPLSVDAGATLEQQLGWQMSWAGQDQQVELLLFRAGDPEPYRRLWLWLDVAP